MNDPAIRQNMRAILNRSLWAPMRHSQSTSSEQALDSTDRAVILALPHFRTEDSTLAGVYRRAGLRPDPLARACFSSENALVVAPPERRHSGETMTSAALPAEQPDV